MTASARPPDQPSRAEVLVVFLAATGLCLVSGVRAYRAGLGDWDGLAALSHALDVLRKDPRMNLALIGFAAPPLPAILHLPASSLVPSLAISGLACPLLGAVALGALAATLNALAANVGLPRVLRWFLVACLVGHPLLLGLAAGGSPVIVLAAANAAAAAALVRWTRDDHSFRDLLTCALYLAAALLTGYEALWVIGAATFFVAARTLRDGGWPRAEGTLIAFLLPVAYAAAVWIMANWAIMGDPLHFWHQAVARYVPNAASLGQRLALTLWAAGLAFPPLFAVTYHEMRLGAAPRGGPVTGQAAAWLVLGALVGTVFRPRALAGSSNDLDRSLISFAATVGPLGFLLLATTLARHLGPAARGGRKPLAGSLLLLGLGCLAAVWAYQNGLRPPALVDTSAERHVALAILRHLQPGQKAFVLGGPGFAVSLFSGTPSQVMVYDATGTDAPAVASGDLVAVHDTADRAALQAALRSRKLTLRDLSEKQLTPWNLGRVTRAAPRPPRGAPPEVMGLPPWLKPRPRNSPGPIPWLVTPTPGKQGGGRHARP